MLFAAAQADSIPKHAPARVPLFLLLLCAAGFLGLLCAHIENSVFGGRLLRPFPVWDKVRDSLLVINTG